MELQNMTSGPPTPFAHIQILIHAHEPGNIDQTRAINQTTNSYYDADYESVSKAASQTHTATSLYENTE